MNRKVLWAVLVIGAALIIAPLAMGLPGKAAAGERMMGDFRPLMNAANVQTTADYYYDTFVPLGKVVPMMSATNIGKFENYVNGFGALPAILRTSTQPAAEQLLRGLPQMQRDFTGFIGVMKANIDVFENVPAGLAHYKPLVDTMQGNVTDYKRINSLPNFNLFTWFFVVPGILLVLVSLYGLFPVTKTKPIRHVRPTPAH